MEDLKNYLKQFISEDIPESVLNVLKSYVARFNGRTGPAILPEVGDYTLDLISTEGIELFKYLNFRGESLDILFNFLFNYQSPVGHVISFLGTLPPDGFLLCDGTLYNIEDYKLLTSHFESHFGSANYFGGDGETTFAVPDLRGEFLRGAGTATRATGSGAGVGVHQDPTKHIYGAIWNNYFAYFNPSSNINIFKNEDATFGESTESVRYSNWTGYAGVATHYTERPTNTSVMFCIKY